ncbi:MAG: hypothetical protein HKN41_00760, partial [Ilumatobacter sp.]|nr:hypothetical protein [Ilumatobacter sp.]
MTLGDRACGSRHPMVDTPVLVPATAADPVDVVHASVARFDAPARSAGGGAARSAADARTAAVAEALERYAASTATVPIRRASEVAPGRRTRLADVTLHSEQQRRSDDFPHADAYPDDEYLGQVFRLDTNEEHWVPAALVSLTDDHGALATSSGLAAATTVTTALLRGLQELVERDAFVSTWLHGLGGREVATPEVGRELHRLGGEMRVFDITPHWSPHPVALVTGTAPLSGAPRHSLGVACRASWPAAVEKAALECCQGIVFVGHELGRRPHLVGISADGVHGFDEHAIFYTANPAAWAELPLFRRATVAPTPPDAPPAVADDADEAERLGELVGRLSAAGVAAFYRELTTVDCNQLGLRVVRVVAPALTPLHHDHRWPFLGGTT